MTLSDLFIQLRAPLVNLRWSWGGISSDGAVVLRVWGDETVSLTGRRFVRLINRQAYEGAPENLGSPSDAVMSKCLQMVRLALR
jgi:hypothetical protein